LMMGRPPVRDTLAACWATSRSRVDRRRGIGRLGSPIRRVHRAASQESLDRRN
jgi:hypothetical protein